MPTVAVLLLGQVRCRGCVRDACLTTFEAVSARCAWPCIVMCFQAGPPRPTGRFRATNHTVLPAVCLKAIRKGLELIVDVK